MPDMPYSSQRLTVRNNAFERISGTSLRFIRRLFQVLTPGTPAPGALDPCCYTIAPAA
jgi:hypothetical protein